MSQPPTAESLLEQLRCTHLAPLPLVDVSAAVEAAARTWHRRIQEQRRDRARFRDDGQLWQWEDLTPHDQAALLALVGPFVEAALSTIKPAPDPPQYVQLDERRPCSCRDNQTTPGNPIAPSA